MEFFKTMLVVVRIIILQEWKQSNTDCKKPKIYLYWAEKKFVLIFGKKKNQPKSYQETYPI